MRARTVCRVCAAVLIAMCIIAVSPAGSGLMRSRTAEAADGGYAAPVISLSQPFSDNGMATEMTMDYGDTVDVPEVIATYNGERIEGYVTVEYLGSGGWTEIGLPEDRKIVLGNVEGEDYNRTAMYVFTFGAEADGKRTEAVYTVYVGLQLYFTATGELHTFVGEETGTPTCLGQYYYLDGTRMRFVPFELTREIIFTPTGGEPRIVSDTDVLLPDATGEYTVTYSTPGKIESGGVTYTGAGVSVSRSVAVYSERTDPRSGGDGFYGMGYYVGGTSAIGQGMVASSCDPEIGMKKDGNRYYILFTQTAAQYMYNLKMKVGGKSLGILVAEERTEGAQSLRTFVVSLDETSVQAEIAVNMYIGPMSRDVNFTIALDLANAYPAESFPLLKREEYPAAYVPEISASSAEMYVKTGSVVTVPAATADMGGENCEVTAEVYYDQTLREYTEVTDGTFVAAKEGVYVIVYTAETTAYTTSTGAPSRTEFERLVNVSDDYEQPAPDGGSGAADVGGNASAPDDGAGGIGAGMIVCIAVGGALALGAVCAFVFALRRRKK